MHLSHLNQQLFQYQLHNHIDLLQVHYNSILIAVISVLSPKLIAPADQLISYGGNPPEIEILFCCVQTGSQTARVCVVKLTTKSCCLKILNTLDV